MKSRQTLSHTRTNPSASKPPSSFFLLVTLTLHCIIAIQPTAVAGAECPSKCTCPPQHNNTVVDCSNALLTAPPRTSLDTKVLILAHNALGPIVNDSFPRMSRLTDLDLSYNGLSRLLGCTLQGMLGLKRFTLRGNRLTSLPDSLFTDASDLEHLDISHNILTSIPDHVFRNVANLKSLDASHNRMVQLEFGLALQVPRHLLSIDLSHNHFQNISSDAFQMASGWQPGFKRTLNLAHCRLTSIQSPALNKIPGLNDLDLSGNPGLPQDNLTSAIKELEATGLERLSLSSLNLTTLEPFFSQVTTMALKFLNASDNLIENIPENTFSTISSLRVFDISGNKLNSLDKGFSDLRNLKVLNVSSNSLTSFKGDDIVSNLNKLKILDLSNNELSNPGEVNLGPLTSLINLTASDNHLTSVVLPETTNHLKHFDFHANAITSFAGFEHVPNLTYFDLSDNDLQEVGDYLFKQSLYLKVVNFSRNSIAKLHTNAFLPKSALVVDLSHNFIEKISYSNWLATQELYLNDNDIEDLDFESFHLMTGLRILDMSDNKLPSLHDDLFDYTSNLIYLNVSQNSIQQTNFPLLFRNLENLEILDMGGNNISHLDKSMLVPIPKLKRLLLPRNHLEVVRPRVFRDSKHIENIDLSGNPFLCTCENLGFQDWIIRTRIKITGLYAVNSSSYECKGPSNRVGEHITDWSPDRFECDKTMLYMIICGSVGLTLILAGIVSTIVYRVYKCHKRRKLEKEKARFRKNCYGIGYDTDDDDVDGYKKKGGKLDLSKMTSDEIAEEITNAIERRERRSMRRAEEMKKKNSNGHAPWQSNGNAKSRDEKKSGQDKDNNNTNSKGRRESIEAKQYDRIMQQQKEDVKQRHSPDNGGKKGSGSRESRERRSEERYASRPEDVIVNSSRALKVHSRASPPLTTEEIMRAAQQKQQQQQQQRWKQQQTGRVGSGYYVEPEPEPDYGYETEPATRGGRDGKRYSRWDSLDVWDQDRRGWLIQGQGQGKPHQRSRSQGPAIRDGYMTLPIREHGYSGRSRSSRRDHPRLYLDQYTNEVRFGTSGGGDRKPQHQHHPSRQSRWDAYNNQQQQQQQRYKLRSRSLHHLPVDYDVVRYVDRDDRHHHPRHPQQQQQQQHHQQHPHHQHQHHRQRSDEDDRRPLIGPARAVSQPYLVSENTSDWL